MAGILSIYAEGQSAHQMRCAVAACGGVMESVTIPETVRKELRQRYAESGPMVLASADVQIRDKLSALIYLHDISNFKFLFPKNPLDAAYAREAVRPLLDEPDMLTASSGARGAMWNSAARALELGHGSLSQACYGRRQTRTVLDCAMFPILHRLHHLQKAGEMERADNDGTRRIYAWLQNKYDDAVFRDSMTAAERGLAE